MTDPASAGRHGRRARQLLQRYLVAFGPLHDAERSGLALDQLVVGFFAGQMPSPEGAAASRQLTAALAADAEGPTPAPIDTAWGRFDRLGARLGLSTVELDALLLLVAARLDSATRWLTRAILGDQPWTAELLCAALDPWAIPEPARAATAPASRLVQLGLMSASGEQRCPGAALLAYLAGGDPELGSGAAHADHDATRVLGASASPDVRIVEPDGRVTSASGARPGPPIVARGCHGDRELAVRACQRHGAGLLELSAAALDAADPCAIVIATAIRDRGVLVHGAPRGSTLIRLHQMGVPIVVQLARDTPLAVVDAVCRALGATVVELPEPTLAVRAGWWRAALAERDPGGLAEALALEPIDRDDIHRAIALAALAGGDPRIALHAACRALAPSPLDALVERVTPGGSLEGSAGGDTITALRADLARRTEPAVVFVEPGAQPVAPVAALIARELGLRLYEITAGRALAQPEPLPRWIARVLAAAAAAPAALVLSDVSTLVASDGGELVLPLLRAHRGIAFVHARERAVFSGAP